MIARALQLQNLALRMSRKVFQDQILVSEWKIHFPEDNRLLLFGINRNNIGWWQHDSNYEIGTEAELQHKYDNNCYCYCYFKRCLWWICSFSSRYFSVSNRSHHVAAKQKLKRKVNWYWLSSFHFPASQDLFYKSAVAVYQKNVNGKVMKIIKNVKAI